MSLQRVYGALGDLIFRLRQESGWSLREAAARIGISHSRLDEIEKGIDNHSGKPIHPSYATVVKLARGYGVEAENLLRIAGYEPEIVLDQVEKRLIADYRSLAPRGRESLRAELARLVAEAPAGAES